LEANTNLVENWILSGKPGIGKTTIIHALAAYLTQAGYKVGGIVSPELTENGKRTGFNIRDLTTGREETMAHTTAESPMRVGGYRVLAHNIDAVCGEAFPFAFQYAQVILVDEIGPMELFSQGFKHYVKQTFQQPQPVVAVVHTKANQKFIRGLLKTKASSSWNVSHENRDLIPRQLFQHLTAYLNQNL
jgi:nucleoside-triphosphatase